MKAGNNKFDCALNMRNIEAPIGEEREGDEHLDVGRVQRLVTLNRED